MIKFSSLVLETDNITEHVCVEVDQIKSLTLKWQRHTLLKISKSFQINQNNSEMVTFMIMYDTFNGSVW